MGYWEYDTGYYEPSEFDEKCEELKDYGRDFASIDNYYNVYFRDEATAQKYADWLNDNECKSNNNLKGVIV